jgi:hypothetical protein
LGLKTFSKAKNDSIMRRCLMKTRYCLLIFTACLITLTVLVNAAVARDIRFTAQRCGVATVDSANLSDDPSITMHSFVEKGTLTSNTATPLPGMWDGIQYSCNGYVVEISLTTGKYKFASGVCRFKDNQGDSIIANMNSGGSKVDFQFKNGTGRWRGVTGSGKGTGEMPFSGAGQHCSDVTIKVRTP